MKKKILFVLSLFFIMTILFMGCTQSEGSSGGGGGGHGGGGDGGGPTPIDYNAMVTIPAITNFPMGYTGVATPVHTVPSISSFKIGKYEVTYDRWYTVYQWAILPAHGYTFSNAGREGNDGTDGAAPTPGNHEPVTQINWRDAIVWCNALSQMEGLMPVYFFDASFGPFFILKVSTNTGSIDSTIGSVDNPYVNWASPGYRLPTEAEWEACARYQNGTTWTTGTYASGATADYSNATATGLVAWYAVNSGLATHNVGTKNANQLGLYDMSGNVWEWCWDWYGAYTTLSPYTDSNPKGHAYDIANPYRMIRGGSWNNISSSLRVSNRDYGNPYGEDGIVGFRVVRK